MHNIRSWFAVALFSLTSIAYAVDFNTFTANMRQHAVLGGDFVQEKTIAGFPKPLISNGRFTFFAGQGIEWNTLAPLASKTWLTSKAITIENQFGQQSITNQTHPMIGVIGSLMMSLFTADMTVLNQHFVTTLDSAPNGWRLGLVPQSSMAKTLFDSLTISGSDYPQTIHIVEKTGDLTLIRFKAVSALKDIPEGLKHAR